jgi:glycosyltransferase involved in cell wall biosynthesis/peptidoglycan/xylan/chitin deacetylase (PgdA/CDA1 family)
MTLSIILATYQRRALLEQTFPTVLAQQPASAFEVVVVVDGSTDGTAAYLRGLAAPLVRVIEQENAGPAAARNAGAAAASGDILLFLDDDILCPPTLARLHLEAHRAAAVPAVISGRVLVSDASPKGVAREIARRETAWGYARLRDAGRIEWPTGTLVDANSSLPRKLFFDAGGFDPSYRRSETNEFGFRLHKAGVPFVDLPQAAAWQIFAKTPREMCADTEWHARAEIRLSRAFPEYRPHCALAGMGDGPAWKRPARRLLARLPKRLLSLVPVAKKRADSITLQAMYLRRSAALWRSAAGESGNWKSLEAEFGKRLPVLLYHHVGPLAAGSHMGMSIPAAMFERQMRCLTRHGYTTISTGQWTDWVRNNSRLPQKPVLLTFDDALADLTKYAFPVLKELDLKAVCFAVTNKLGGRNDWSGVQTGHERLMTREEVKEWSEAGIEFGAHTRTHPDLRTLTLLQLEDEIAGSRADLEDLLGTMVRSFAYTYGDYNAEAVACARRHFDCSFTCEEGVNTLTTDLHLLRRTMMSPFDWTLDFRLRLRYGCSPIIRLRSDLALRTRLRRMMGGGS